MIVGPVAVLRFCIAGFILCAMGIALACIAGLMAIVNLVQVVIGRQLVRPSKCKRPVHQLRHESGAAALGALGVVLVDLHLLLGVVLVVIGSGWIVVTRKRIAVG